jgi:hypothetical protein
MNKNRDQSLFQPSFLILHRSGGVCISIDESCPFDKSLTSLPLSVRIAAESEHDGLEPSLLAVPVLILPSITGLRVGPPVP